MVGTPDRLASGLAFLAGAALPLQAGADAVLARLLGHPSSAALASALVGVFSMPLTVPVLRAPGPSPAALKATPLWSWTGGVVGAGFLVLATISAPRLGAATFVALALAGQMTLPVLIDHFGWIGFGSRSATLGRLAGVVLVVAGVVLARFSGRVPD